MSNTQTANRNTYRTQTIRWNVHFLERDGEWWDSTAEHLTLESALEAKQRFLEKSGVQDARVIEVVTTENEVVA